MARRNRNAAEGAVPNAVEPKRTDNLILGRLPASERERLLACSKTVSWPRGHEAYREGGPMPYAYFPVSGVWSILIHVAGGGRIETGVVGSEGMIGLPVFEGLDASPFTAAAQIPGESIQVPAASFLRAVTPGSSLERLLRRYSAYLTRYGYQAVACNTVHAVENRMCRWILMAQDRVERDEFALTHEFLAEMLGVQRPTVSIVAGNLQQAGIITYRRGVMRVLDRERLEAASCECYQVLKDMYARIMQ